jgi:hypothetical protein
LVAFDAARTAGTNIIHVRTCFRPGHPDISSRNATGGKIAQFGGFVEGDGSNSQLREVDSGT